MNDKEMIDKADKIVNDIASSVAIVSVGISLIKLGFEAGSKSKAEELTPYMTGFSHMGD